MMSRISRDLAAHNGHGRSSPRSLSSLSSLGQRTPRVAVIGAGLSGLRCADILLRNGVSVTMFEARDRIGGRVFQQAAGKHVFDMGPNWIHGTEDNPMMTLAEKTGTVITELEERQFIFDSTGQMKPKQEARELGANTWATIVDAFKYSDEHHTSIDPQTSLMDFFKESLATKFPNDEVKVRESINEARMWGPFIGEPIDRQSLRNFFLEQCLEGENVIVASTYGKMLSEVAQKAQQEAKWRFAEEVVNIEYRNVGDSDSPVALTTAQGARCAYDEIVVTCPLGWLKKHKVDAFSPPLPPHLNQAIDNIGYGHLEKVYATFSSVWWTDSVPDVSANETADLAIAEGPLGQDVPFSMHFHHPSYHPDPASKQSECWNQAVINLAKLPGSCASPTLLFYTHGPCSQHVTSMLKSCEPGSAAYNSVLYDFVKPFLMRLPGYSPANPACTPISFVATQWSNDPYAGFGSYSNFQVGLMHGDEDIKCMREAGGLSEQGRGLWLAGEHTAPFVAIGTTTGAYWSGEGVAKRILERYNINPVQMGNGEMNGISGEGERTEPNGEAKDGAKLAALAI